MNKIEEIYQIVNGIDYSRHVPKEAEKIAKENNIVIIVGGSDDLMYCYGAKSYLTDWCEHSEGWDGSDLSKSSDKKLRREAKQLGLKIFWCGEIVSTGETCNKKGSFSYTVDDNIKHKDFIVYENLEEYGPDDIYCTGIIIKLPDNFKTST
jgi:hypothetical protein